MPWTSSREVKVFSGLQAAVDRKVGVLSCCCVSQAWPVQRKHTLQPLSMPAVICMHCGLFNSSCALFRLVDHYELFPRYCLAFCFVQARMQHVKKVRMWSLKVLACSALNGSFAAFKVLLTRQHSAEL